MSEPGAEPQRQSEWEDQCSARGGIGGAGNCRGNPRSAGCVCWVCVRIGVSLVNGYALWKMINVQRIERFFEFTKVSF